ncbi:choice-of-anchor D domain-containing protein [Flavobacterium sp. F-328]|uniref:Choice-of-anchor D domain-containing protein n=1 Tax=Flavobacterium erciyesense TaxID=2825842 RepID=A0ABS5D2M0_9FLAO|nr:choice-of-anchor D domain-containing protein [Flavobacterium erciyesense]MBQ0908265.1 choice-of-anchor D domain-containing protein [Flavobacterium erciyesense]
MMKTLPSFKKNYYLIALLLVVAEGFAQIPIQYDADGIFTVPAGVTNVTVEAWGAGGRGATRTSAGRGGGGGGGAYAKGTVSVSAAASPYTIMVGLGSTTIAAGEDSWFGSATTVMAKGGDSAANNSTDGATGGSAAASIGNPATKFSGGNGAARGSILLLGNFSGGGGAAAGNANNGANGNDNVGGTGNNPGGSGGDGRVTNGNGQAGSIPGGGGGGAFGNGNTGGAGGNGRVIVSWTCPTYNLASITTPTPLCTGTSATVTLNSTVAQLPNGNYTISYTISAPNAGTYTANVTVAAGTASFTTPALNNAGSTTITVSTISSGTAPSICSSSVNFSATIVVNQQPVIATTTPASRVGIGSVTLGATASIGNVRWYANPTGGAILETNTSYTTPVLLTTTTYYVEAVNAGCISAPRVPVIATIDLPEIAVSGNGFNIPDEDTTPIVTDNTNFGTINLTVASTKTYTIQNTGTINLTVGTINISGLNASEFVVTTVPAAVVAPGGSTTFNITFTPTISGNRVASVSFSTNDADENPFNFDIAGTGGTGVAPEINLRGNGNNILDGASGPVATNFTDFASTLVGTPQSRVFTIQNTGTGPLLLTGTPLVSLSGSATFTVSSPPPGTSIPAGGSANFTITFTPLIAGTFVALVTIENSDSDEGIYDFAIKANATVTGIEIDIQGNEISITNGDTTPNVADQTDFGTTNTTTQIKLPFQIYSQGNNTLTISSITISGTNASQFSVPSISGTLDPGQIASFVVTFTPNSTLGIKTATLTVVSNDPNEGTYTFAIRAEVQTPTAQIVAPGGVTGNLKFWLKANSNIGAISDNTLLSNWTDQTTASTKNAVARFTKEPRFRDAAGFNVNFNPVVQFNGNNWMSGSQGFNNSDFYIVVKPTVTFNRGTSAQDIYSGDDVGTNQASQDVTGFQMGASSARYDDEVVAYNQAANTVFGVAEISTTKSYTGVNMFNPRKTVSGTPPMEILNNGNILSTTSVATGTYIDMVNTRYWLGRSEFFDASFNGAILEVINYDSRNSDSNKSRIESYLAIKYGITLGTNGTSLPYVNSAGTTIYGANQGYNYNIAGIGRDDNSQLNQKQSKSENTASDITIGLGDIFATNSANTNTFGADRTFLMWGHNNNTLAAQAPIVVNMSSGITPALNTDVDFVAVGRTWKVIENGIIGTVKVSIPSVMLTATITPPGDFLMFISDSPIFSPTAEYRIMNMNGSNLEALYDFNGTKYITFGYAPERTFVRSVDFDGVNDYMDAGNVLNLPTNFTVSAWVKKASNNKTILSKRNAAFTEGYDLSINSTGHAEMSWFNGSTHTLTSSVPIPTNIWHHVAVIYNGTIATMYIDGVANTSVTAPAVLANTQSFLIGAANGASPNRFFDGNIDEVRVWSTALTVNQLRYSMNQEILRNGTFTNGVIIPNNITLNEISAIPWSSLSAYYPMSTYTYTNAKDISNNNFTAAIKNLNTVDYQTAPLPYESAANGNWETPATWTNSAVQDRPYSTSIIDNNTPIDWNIVRTAHDVTSNANKTVLGLFVNSNTLSASSDSKIEVTNYLRLDGKIDLVGRSQLVQKTGSDLDILSSGTLERDQQGQANLYNYNYWGSPVGISNTTSNNNAYTVESVLRDGTTASAPGILKWTDALNANPSTTPKTLSRYWINKFDNQANAYANWSKIGEKGNLRAGQGFTLKGSGAVTGTQNLVFVGKPNNGEIINTVNKNQLLLVGNPYPSALDADKFITDNLGGSNDVITGSLYFWEHYTDNSSHFLKQYQGGYGVRNFSGGTEPSSMGLTTISGFGATNKAAPNQFIPVGQGFFVIGNASGASTNLKFNNSQREFIKEGEAQSQTMYRTTSSKVPVKDHWTDNSSTKIEPSSNKKIHIGFNLLSNNFHRQVLLAFMDERADSEINPGYDAPNIDGSPSDMYLLNKDQMLSIQGEGYFNKEASYPIAVKMEEEGKVSFVIDKLENFDADQNYFIYDAQTDTYNSIKKGPFEVLVAKGEHKTRFALHFTDKKAATVIEDPNATNNKIEAIFTRYNNTLNITNGVKDATIETVQLYNIQGSCIKTWDIKDKTQFYHKLPITENSSEFYIVKIKTSKGIMTQKIIVK